MPALICSDSLPGAQQGVSPTALDGTGRQAGNHETLAHRVESEHRDGHDQRSSAQLAPGQHIADDHLRQADGKSHLALAVDHHIGKEKLAPGLRDAKEGDGQEGRLGQRQHHLGEGLEAVAAVDQRRGL